jgi:hypothetical protein
VVLIYRSLLDYVICQRIEEINGDRCGELQGKLTCGRNLVKPLD